MNAPDVAPEDQPDPKSTMDRMHWMPWEGSSEPSFAQRYYWFLCNGMDYGITYGNGIDEDTSGLPPVLVDTKCAICGGTHDMPELTKAAYNRLRELGEGDW